MANNLYSEQKSIQLSPEDACSVRQSNTLGFISVNNSCTYPVITFGTVCVDVIVITVAVTQFIKTIHKNFGRSNIFVRAVKSEINHSSHGGVAMVVDCAIDFFLNQTA